MFEMVGFNFRNFFLRNDAIYARILQLTISGILFSAAPAVWVSLGYLDPFAWFLEWADIVLAFILMISSLRTKVLTSTLRLSSMVFISLAIAIASFYESSYYPTFILFFIPLMLLGLGLTLSKGNAKYSSLLFFITAVTVLSAFSILYLAVAPAIPTDETLLTLYAAHIFLNGLNPYSPGVMNNSFAFYNFPVYLGTPFTTGGNVHSLTYPALSFILQIPSAVFNLRTSYIMLPFLMIPAFLIWFKTWSVKKWKESILVLFPLIGLLIYSSQASNADLNPVWASFLMTSYFVLPRTKLSGVFLGLSLALKQLPIFSIPFYLYYIHREYGSKKAIVWILIAVTVFLAINGYFMFENFSNFLTSITQDELSSMIGVGLGPSQLSFLGFLPLSSTFFTAITFITFAVSMAIYVRKYPDLKYALFAFPAIIFFFNYRYFEQYSFYWLVVSLLPIAEILGNRGVEGSKPAIVKPSENLLLKNKNIKRLAVGIVIVLISSGFVIHFSTQTQTQHFQINSVVLEDINSSGYVKRMSVNIVFEGKLNATTHVLFRVITPGRIENANMYLWKPANSTIIHSRDDYVLTIYPTYPEYSFRNNGTFRLIAYYGGIQGTYVFS